MNRSETNAPRGKDNMTAEGAKRFSPLLALFSCLLRGAGEKRELITTVHEHNRIGMYVGVRMSTKNVHIASNAASKMCANFKTHVLSWRYCLIRQTELYCPEDFQANRPVLVKYGSTISRERHENGVRNGVRTT